MFIVRPKGLKFLWLLLCVPAIAWSQMVPAQQAAAIRIAMIEGLSGNTGEAVHRNLLWAVERVNQRGRVKLPAPTGGNRVLRLDRYDRSARAARV